MAITDVYTVRSTNLNQLMGQTLLSSIEIAQHVQLEYYNIYLGAGENAFAIW